VLIYNTNTLKTILTTCLLYLNPCTLSTAKKYSLPYVFYPNYKDKDEGWVRSMKNIRLRSDSGTALIWRRANEAVGLYYPDAIRITEENVDSV
jgi:hypothetical protein